MLKRRKLRVKFMLIRMILYQRKHTLIKHVFFFQHELLMSLIIDVIIVTSMTSYEIHTKTAIASVV